MRPTRFPLLAVPLAVLVALAAPATAGESKSDKAILEAGVITKQDVPANWKSRKSSSSSFKGGPECKSIRTAVDNANKKVPRADSRNFEDRASDSLASAESTVYAFKDVTAAASFVAKFQGDLAATCLRKSLAKSTAGKKAAGAPTISPITDLDGVGDEAAGHEMTIDIPVGGQTATAYIDFIVVQAGRAAVGFGFTNLGERIPDGPAIVQTLISRVAQAQTPA